MRFLFIAVLLLSVSPLQAKEIAGVMVQEVVKTDNGTEMILNGAGVRSKFFFDIYIAELYMEHPAANVEDILSSTGGRRMVMYFLHEKVGKDKLVDGWVEGFSGNNDAKNVEKLQSRIDIFNDMFVDVKKGDRVVLDYVPATGTIVTVANEEKGVVEGKDFNDALLLIWLGKKPVNKKLKKQLLSFSS